MLKHRWLTASCALGALMGVWLGCSDSERAPWLESGGGAGGSAGDSSSDGGTSAGGTSAGGASAGGASASGSGGQAAGGSSAGTGGNPVGAGAHSSGGAAHSGDAGTNDDPDASADASTNDPAAGGTSSADSDAGGSLGEDAGAPSGDPNYVSRGVWHGYTFSTADDASEIQHSGMCASGFVGAAEDIDSFGASWTWNLQQLEGAEFGDNWPLAGSGVHYQVSRSDDETLQLILLDENFDSWCAPLAADDASIAWTDFHATCAGGPAFDGATALYAIGVLIPNSASADEPFDFCMDALAPVP